jgi:hypothetical protein
MPTLCNIAPTPRSSQQCSPAIARTAANSLRKQGRAFWFRPMTAWEAAQLSAAALMQVATRQGPSKFLPFDGPDRLLLQSLWETLHNAAVDRWRRTHSAPLSSAACSPRRNASTLVMQWRAPSRPSWTGSAQPGPLALNRRHGYAAAQPPSSWTRCQWLSPLTIPDTTFTSGMRHSLCL